MVESFAGVIRQNCAAFGLAICLAVGLSACKKPVATEPEEPPAATPTPPPVVAVATPTPPAVVVATPAPPESTPSAPELAPPGVFYLIVAARVETKNGIMGLPPGTGVKLVRPGIYLTPAGEVPLSAEQMTNDLVVARRVAAADKNKQAALRQQIAASAATGVNPKPAGPAAAVATKAGRDELTRLINANFNQTNQLATTLNNASTQYGGNWQIAARKSPQVFQLLQQYNELVKQRQELDSKLSQL